MVIFLYKIGQNESLEIDNSIVEEEIQTIEEDKTKIIVHITGCVEHEGIVELDEGARISDAIKSAGGATLDANMSKVNLAYKLKDGQKIYVPSNIDTENNRIITDKGEGVLVEENNTNGKININTASQTELETLPRNRSFDGKKDNRLQK